jgi:hypothetical protein
MPVAILWAITNKGILAEMASPTLVATVGL